MSKVGKDGKFQFVFVNIEGDQETLQEALRQVGTVLNHGLKPVPARTLIAVPAPKTIGNGVNSENNTDSDIYEVLPEEPTDKEPLTAGDTKSKTAAKPKREKKAGRVPELLKDFDPNAAEVAMNDFFNHHDTNSQFNKYLAIAAWFKPECGRDHAEPHLHLLSAYEVAGT
jgi:hypothetical protein